MPVLKPDNDIFHSAAFEKKLDAFIDLALKEDIGDGDHTSLATIAAHTQAEGKLMVKQGGIIAGIELAKRIFKRVDRKIMAGTQNFASIQDGAKVKKGDIVFTVKGPARSLLMTERVVLNCMQRMSGIATQAHQLTLLCKGTKAIVLDTRKTTPGMRLIEKWAVVIGGAANHRWGLYDMILIKDNHIACSGGIKKAIESTRTYLKFLNKKLEIEIEAGTIEQVKEIIAAGGVNRILLDNFTPEEMRKAVILVNGRYKTEASGGITKENIRQYALTGVDYISVGALTHSVKSMDMNLKIKPLKKTF